MCIFIFLKVLCAVTQSSSGIIVWFQENRTRKRQVGGDEWAGESHLHEGSAVKWAGGEGGRLEKEAMHPAPSAFPKKENAHACHTSLLVELIY